MKQKLAAYWGFGGAVAVTVAALAIPLPISTRFLLMVLAALFSMAGVAYTLPRLLERTALSPEGERVVETILEDVRDDLQDIKHRTITSTHLMIALTALLSIAFAWLVLFHAKLGAKWGPIPVLIPAAVAVWAATDRMLKSHWYRLRRVRTPFWVFAIPLAGMLISTPLGIYMTEPLEYGGSTAYERAAAAQPAPAGYDYRSTRANHVYLNYIPNGTGWLNVGSAFDSCDGDACGIILLAIALIIIALVLICGSALIPHFWVLAGFTFLTLMGVMAIRELRVRPES